MRKISLLIALCMLLTIGGVYATWTYTNSTDVKDESISLAMNLTNATFVGTYGTFEIIDDGLTMKIDPKEGSTHITALYITGELVIKFTPNVYAPQTVKDNGIEATYTFSVSSPNWKYEDKAIATITHEEPHQIDDWVKQDDGSFTKTLNADALKGHFALTEFLLDNSVKYDQYNNALSQGSIVITVSDGYSAQQ